MALRSGNHQSAAQRSDGSWYCDSCEADSFDFEFFEEAGDLNHCIPPQTSVEKVAAFRDVARAQQHIRDATEAMKRTGRAAEDAADRFEEFETVIKAWSGEIVQRWPGTPMGAGPWKVSKSRVTHLGKTGHVGHWSESLGTGTATVDGVRLSSTGSLAKASTSSTTAETSAFGPVVKGPSTSRALRTYWLNSKLPSGSFRGTTKTTHKSWTRKTPTAAPSDKS